MRYLGAFHHSVCLAEGSVKVRWTSEPRLKTLMIINHNGSWPLSAPSVPDEIAMEQGRWNEIIFDVLKSMEPVSWWPLTLPTALASSSFTDSRLGSSWNLCSDSEFDCMLWLSSASLVKLCLTSPPKELHPNVLPDQKREYLMMSVRKIATFHSTLWSITHIRNRQALINIKSFTSSFWTTNVMCWTRDNLTWAWNPGHIGQHVLCVEANTWFIASVVERVRGGLR